MVIDLVAVVEDGSRPEPSLPNDLHQAISIRRGETTTLRVKLVTRGGAPVRFISGDSLTFTARSLSPGQRVLFTATVSAPTTGTADGYYELVLASSVTAWVAQSRALWDLWFRRASTDYAVIPQSTLLLPAPAAIPPSSPPTPTP